jgi:hypothetical protein
MPLTLHAWKCVFREASRRCRRLGLRNHGHPHALRRNFAVQSTDEADMTLVEGQSRTVSSGHCSRHRAALAS